MPGNISIVVEPTAGSDIADCMESAALAINALGLHHATFITNGSRWVVYPDGRAYQYPESGGHILWTREPPRWTATTSTKPVFPG